MHGGKRSVYVRPMTASTSPSVREPARASDTLEQLSVSADTFKTVFRGHPGGVALITAQGANGPVALTASSVSSVSVDPPLLVFSVSALSSAAETITSASTIVVHLLDAEDIALARLGATSGVDRFADATAWAPLATGEPVFTGARAWVRCSVVSRMEAGGSTVIAAHGLQAHIDRDADRALVYHDRTWHALGEHSLLR